MGSRALSDWQSLIQHSVSHQLLCALDCPLLIVDLGSIVFGSVAHDLLRSSERTLLVAERALA